MISKLIKLLSSKIWITFLSLLIQVAIVVVAMTIAMAYATWILLVFDTISFLICLYIVSRDMNPSYKLSWCILILVIPAFGGMLYILIGRQHTPRRMRKKIRSAEEAAQVLWNATNAYMLGTRATLDPTGTTCAELVNSVGSFPVYGSTATKYYPLGELMFPDMLDDIKRAEHFILMEYFIIEPGKIWDELEAALIERAAAGVDVRIMYDDVGCVFTLPKKTKRKLKAAGIKIAPFNRLTPSFDMRLNNRTHRKITVVDGKVAYCGGNNIADEYANKYRKFGHWKDTHMRFEGAAVWSFTTMFLSFWHAVVPDELLVYKNYYASTPVEDASGYVQPLSSGPGRNDHLIQSAFINLISTAKRYVYITTPYLILDNETQTALISAAKSGVDVRIIIPGVPDKKIVYLTTKSFVPLLVRAGVKVYTYTPGFIHAKMLITDDERAFIGTCNMDYRSFYLHYECGALLYNTDTVQEMRTDFLATAAESKAMTHERAKGNVVTRFLQSLMRLLAPLL